MEIIRYALEVLLWTSQGKMKMKSAFYFFIAVCIIQTARGRILQTDANIVTKQHDDPYRSSNAEECPASYIRDKSGTCIACPDGFQGKNCSKICPHNYYGEKCLFECSCAVNQVCDYKQGCIEIGTDPSSEILPEEFVATTYSVPNKRTSATRSNEYDHESPTTMIKTKETEPNFFVEKPTILKILKPLLKYIVPGLIAVLIINICCCVMIKRNVLKRGINRSNDTDTSPDNVELPVTRNESASRPSSQRNDGAYAEVMEVPNIYSYHSDDQYHVLSFSRNTRRSWHHHDASLYHHADTSMTKKVQGEPLCDIPITATNRGPATISDSTNQRREQAEIYSVSQTQNDQRKLSNAEDSNPYSFARGCQVKET